VQRFKLASQDDFEQFAWTIVFLAMGGIALGKGVTNSGLLETMDVVIRDLLEGFSLYTVVLILTPVVLVCTLRYRSYAMSRFSRRLFRLSRLSSAIR
jgi:di/tricarboxylate transporter